MTAGLVIISILISMTGFVVALFFDFSFWHALGVYSLAGSSILALLTFAIAAKRTKEGNRTANGAHDGEISAIQAKPAETGPTNGTSIRILAVDNDPSILELIPMLLAKSGFSNVTGALSGAEALSLLSNSERHFDCMLFDIRMPDMDGIELCRRVRRIRGYAETPVIMLTALRDLKNMGKAYRAGATDYVTKPFDIADLGSRLRLIQLAELAKTQCYPPEDRRETDPQIGTPDDRLYETSEIEGLVGALAWKNYLTRLPFKDVANVKVYAVTLQRSESVRSICEGPHLGFPLDEVVLAVKNCLGEDRLVLACANTVTLMVATTAVNTPTALRIEKQIEAWMRSKGYEDEVAVGGPILSQGQKSERADLAIDRALSCAKVRTLEKNGAPSFKAWAN